MYQEDHLANVGYLRNGDHMNNPRWASSYKAAFAFGPRSEDLPPAMMVDLDEPERRTILERYRTVVQNLRLIKGNGRNVWSRQERRWSEVAMAMDGEGRLLLLFSRQPYPMWDFNHLLLAMPLGIVRAMHMEGGPEASLSIHAGGLDLDLCGSYESGFYPRDSNNNQRRIPNVLGVTLSAPAP